MSVAADNSWYPVRGEPETRNADKEAERGEGGKNREDKADERASDESRRARISALPGMRLPHRPHHRNRRS